MTGSYLGLTERGNVSVIPEREWQMYGLDEASTLLRRLGVIGEGYASGFRIIEPRQFVGHYRSSSCSIRIDPRRSELFEDLRRFVAVLPEKRRAAENSAEPDEQLHETDPAILFCFALEDAVQAGLPFLYRQVLVMSSNPRGRINFTETLRTFQSRGIRHKVVCGSSAREYDAQLTRVLSTVISLLRRDYSIPNDLLSRMELLACLFEDAPIYSIPEAVNSTETLIGRYDDWAEVRRLLLLSQSILTNQQEVWDLQIPVAGGECRFCNMDRLWEIAVLTAFKRAWIGHTRMVEYHPYRGRKIMLFPDGGPEIDPDIVAFEEGKPKLVVDAKYSDAQEPSASDIYQLLSYARRLNADYGVLVYLSSHATWYSRIGTADGNVVISAGGASTVESSQGLLQLAGSACSDYETAIVT